MISLDQIVIIATLLGGIVAIWFLYDKLTVIRGWFKFGESNESKISAFSVDDNDFGFLNSNLISLTKSGHIPKDEQEKQACISLLNQGILHCSFFGKYKLTRLGKKMVYQQ